jgi:hypothetical protein
MSDTPETDKREYHPYPRTGAATAVHADFARKLERERNAAKADKQRLDFLEANAVIIGWSSWSYNETSACRSAIDKVMKEEGRVNEFPTTGADCNSNIPRKP